MQDFISETVANFHKKQEKLTKEQFTDCLNEAILSGDFVRHCTQVESGYHEGIENTLHGGGEFNISQKQGMTYVPYREKVRLVDENIRLKDILERYSENVDYYKNELAGSWFDIKKDADELVHK